MNELVAVGGIVAEAVNNATVTLIHEVNRLL